MDRPPPSSFSVLYCKHYRVALISEDLEPGGVVSSVGLKSRARTGALLSDSGLSGSRDPSATAGRRQTTLLPSQHAQHHATQATELTHLDTPHCVICPNTKEHARRHWFVFVYLTSIPLQLSWELLITRSVDTRVKS
ncbi:hypothetical protein CBL_05538 [Carabus blaptoides fortunei]